MAKLTQFGTVTAPLDAVAGTYDRNVQIAIKLSVAWRVTMLSGCVSRALMPRTNAPVGFRFTAGIGEVPGAADFTPADLTPADNIITAYGGVLQRTLFDVVGRAETPISYVFGSADTALVIDAGQPFFAMVGRMLYDDGTLSPPSYDLGSVTVYGVPVDKAALNVTLR